MHSPSLTLLCCLLFMLPACGDDSGGSGDAGGSLSTGGGGSTVQAGSSTGTGGSVASTGDGDGNGDGDGDGDGDQSPGDGDGDVSGDGDGDGDACLAPASEDMCGTCDEDAGNDCVMDCSGAWGGQRVEDMCGTCDSSAGNDCVADCNGDWGGTAVLDPCGSCDTDPTNDCACTPAGDCSPFEADDCPDKACRLSGANTICASLSDPGALGDECSGPSCDRGLTCVNFGNGFSCETMCPSNLSGWCPAGFACTGNIGHACIAICLAYPEACDIYLQDCDDNADGCRLAIHPETRERYTGCRPAGSKQLGESCSGSINCVAGLFCISVGGNATCVEACDPDLPTDPCSAGSCTGMSTGWGIGYCM